MSGERDLYAEYQVAGIFQIGTLSVDQLYRRKGLASKLIGQSVEMARNRGFELVTVYPTSVESQKLFDSLQFDLINAANYRDITFHGNQIVTFAGPHDQMQFRAKRILPAPAQF